MKQETKDKASKFWDEVKAGLKSGFNATKKGLIHAGDAIQNYSDLSVVAIEKKQFESKRKKACTELGEIVAKKFSSKETAVSSSDEELVPLLKEIASFSKEISKREKIIKAAEKDRAKAEESKTLAKEPAPKKTAAKKAASKGGAVKAETAVEEKQPAAKKASEKKTPAKKPSAGKVAKE